MATFLCSRQDRAAGYVLERRTCADWNFIHLQTGTATWVLDGVEHPLATGDLIAVPPGVPHHAHGPGRIRIGSLHLTASLPGGRDLFDLVSAPRVLSVPAGSRLDTLLRLAADEFDRDAAPQMPHWSALILKEWLRACGDRLTRRLDPVLAEVLAHLEAHLADDLSLDDLATLSGYTPQHLNRLFRGALGSTPLRIHTDLRLRKAADLLSRGHLSVAGVAEAVGFADPAYFSRQFTARFGRAPRDVLVGKKRD